MSRLKRLVWPASTLSDAITAIAHRNGVEPRSDERSTPLEAPMKGDEEALGPWIEDMARQSGLEAEPLRTPYADLAHFVRNAGPAIVRWPGGDDAPDGGFIVLLKGRGQFVSVLGTDLKVRRIKMAAVCAALRSDMEVPLRTEIDDLLAKVGIPNRRRARARSAILRERLSGISLEGSWMLRLPPGASFWQQMRNIGVARHLVTFVGLHALQYAIFIVSWAVLGWAVLQDRLEPGWLMAWALLLLTIVPLRMLEAWSQSVLSIELGALLKQRLLYGALKLDPEEIKHQGIGQLLGNVLESDAVEKLALTGALVDCVGLLELIFATAILSAGAGGLVHVALLLAWSALCGYLVCRYYRHRRGWTSERLEMTHDMVEQMVGHRTRLAQQEPVRWHEGEDRMLPRYLKLSKRMDRWSFLLNVFISRGWLLVGLFALAPAFVTGAESPTALAIGLGGVLLAYRALVRLSAGLVDVVGAMVAWERSAKLFAAAARPEGRNHGASIRTARSVEKKAPDRPIALEAIQLIFRYKNHGEPTLQNCNLRIRGGDRILLEGPSGGGKSTLVSLLTGLRTPESGLLLLHGLDRRTVGADRWRRCVVAAPQFHDNYILTETFAFNLLMGRGQAPEAEDIEEAEVVCRELGLGALIDRMPSGLLQILGETGWQLSHGEKSRLYIARALLQNADIVVLDESFAALDPETLQQAMHCVLRRADTLVLVAHP